MGRVPFNVYLLLGWAASLAAAMIAPEQTASVGYLGSSVFLAFAWLFPEFRLYLMFVLPVPIQVPGLDHVVGLRHQPGEG